MSGTLSYNQLLAMQTKASANNTSSGKPSQGSASKTTTSGTQATVSTASVSKQPVTKPVSKPNPNTSAPKVVGNLQGGSNISSSSTTVAKTASGFYGSSCLPAANQSASPAVSAPGTISIQKAAVNPPVNTSIPPANPQVASPTTTSTATSLPKSTNALAYRLQQCIAASTAQTVSGSSSAAAAGSLVTSASKGFSSSPLV